LSNYQFKYYPTFWQAVNLIVVYIFIQTIIDFPLALYDYQHGTDWLYQPWIKVPVFFGSTVFILYLGYLYSALPMIQVFPFKWFNPLLLLFMILTFGGLQFYLNEINIQLDKVLPPPSWFLELFSRLFDSDHGVWSGVLRVVIIAPIVEELIFRGVIMTGFIRNYRVGWAIFFSALLFALFHLNPWQFPATFFLGIVLGWLRIRTGSVLACICGHAIHNGLVYLSVVYFTDLKNLSFMQHGEPASFLQNGILMLAGVFLIFLFTRQRRLTSGN
jgi:uncharacterized protein